MANLKIKIEALTAGAAQKLGAFKSKLGSFASSIGGIFKSKLGFMIGGAGIFGAGRGMLSTIEKLDAIGKAAKRMGVSAEEAQKLQFAMKRSGASSEDTEKAFKKMSRTIFDASTGLQTYVKLFKALNIDVKTLVGLSPEEQFSAIADALNEVKDASTQSAIAQQIFGRSGTMLLPMLNSYRELKQELKEIGGVVSNDIVKAAEDAADKLTNVKTALFATFAKSGAVDAANDALGNVNDTLNAINNEEGGYGKKVGLALFGMAKATKDFFGGSPDKDIRSQDDIQRQLEAFKKAKAARLGKTNKEDAMARAAKAAMSTSFSSMPVDSLRSMGANLAGPTRNAAVIPQKLDEVKVELVEIKETVKSGADAQTLAIIDNITNILQDGTPPE